MKYNGKVQTGIEPQPFKVNKLPKRPYPNSVYYLLNDNQTISIYVTDRSGKPLPVGVPITPPPNYINIITSPNSTIDVTTLGNTVGIDIKQSILDQLNNIESDKHFTYTQNTPSSEWIINHPLNKKPAVNVTDSAGNEVEGRVIYLSLNQIKIIFNGAFTGEAYLN